MGRVLTGTNNYDYKTEQHSLAFVEKLWENLRESLWENCGKDCAKFLEKWFYTEFWLFPHSLGAISGKISRWLYTRYLTCKLGVLHNFHRLYYNYY